jgi:hypothetical protein
VDEKTREERSIEAEEEDRPVTWAPKFVPDVEPTGPVGLVGPPRRFELSPLDLRRW